MCGILAVVAKDGVLDSSACRRALATMSWRGPDFAFSRVWEDRVFLAQTVLSITGDPHPGLGRYQQSVSGRYEIFYNGEVYNFQELDARWLAPRFPTRPSYGTDTEILVNLHEVLTPAEVPPLLDGMYAYALFDAEARELHLARDVQGEKSLYIYEDRARVVVASEIRAIRALVPSLRLDRQALRDYFRTRHLMLFGRTVWDGIRELAPGRLETLDLDSGKWMTTGALRLRDWIDSGRLEANRRRSVDSLVDELDELLGRCVREMVPARRYAAVVSGGVDSSILASYAVRHGNPDLLVVVNHVGKDRISADLSGFERALGRAVDVVRVDSGAYAGEITRCQQACGAPLHSHSFVPQAQQSARVRAADCRVLFGGEGADELFGGYEAYLGSAESGRFSPSPYTTRLRPLVRFGDDAPEPLDDELAAAWADALDAYACVDDDGERRLQAMTYCDAACQLPAAGLRGADLMSMMWSVETRSIYLRRPLVQFALNLPGPLKADPAAPALGRAKPLLKRLFLRHFPAELLVDKQGFAGFPNEAAQWLGEPGDYLVGPYLGIEPASLAAAWADRATAWKLINVEYFLRTACDSMLQSNLFQSTRS